MSNDIEWESREAFEQFAIKELGITARGDSPGWRIWQAALEWQAARSQSPDHIADSSNMVASEREARAQSGQGVEPVAFAVYWGQGDVELYEAPLPALGYDPESVTPLYTHPHNGEQGGEWVRCGDRLPELRDADWEGCVWYWSPNFKMARLKWQTVREWSFQSQNMPEQYWKPTGLTRPQPPKSKEGESGQ